MNGTDAQKQRFLKTETRVPQAKGTKYVRWKEENDEYLFEHPSRRTTMDNARRRGTTAESQRDLNQNSLYCGSSASIVIIVVQVCCSMDIQLLRNPIEVIRIEQSTKKETSAHPSSNGRLNPTKLITNPSDEQYAG